MRGIRSSRIDQNQVADAIAMKPRQEFQKLIQLIAVASVELLSEVLKAAINRVEQFLTLAVAAWIFLQSKEQAANQYSAGVNAVIAPSGPSSTNQRRCPSSSRTKTCR